MGFLGLIRQHSIEVKEQLHTPPAGAGTSLPGTSSLGSERFSSIERFFSARLRNATAPRMKPSETQSSYLGYFPPYANANRRVDAVPATSDVSRFTNPA